MKIMNKNGVLQKLRHQVLDQRLMQRISILTKFNLTDICQIKSVPLFINHVQATCIMALPKLVKDFLSDQPVV